MDRRSWPGRRFAGLMLLLALSGCASAPETKIDPAVEQQFAQIDKITMLPVVLLADLKAGARETVSHVIEVQLPLELALKGYALGKTETFSASANYSPTDVAAMTEAELATLGPAGDRYILLCIVNAVSSSYFVVANVGKAQMAAVLLDKQTGQVIWSNRSDKTTSVNWLTDAGLLFIPLINQKAMATYEAFRDLFRTLPEKK